MMSYPWYQIPGRACLLIGALAKSFWQDWFHCRTCRTCRYCDEPWPDQTFCTRELGASYGRPTRLDATCKRWRKP